MTAAQLFLLITVIARNIIGFGAKPQTGQQFPSFTDIGQQQQGGQSPDYSTDPNSQQQQQGNNCFQGQEQTVQDFVFSCRNGNLVPSACLLSRRTRINIGATFNDGDFLWACVQPTASAVSLKSVACVSNGVVYYPGGGTYTKKHFAFTCVQKLDGHAETKILGCAGDDGQPVPSGGTATIGGRLSRCSQVGANWVLQSVPRQQQPVFSRFSITDVNGNPGQPFNNGGQGFPNGQGFPSNPNGQVFPNGQGFPSGPNGQPFTNSPNGGQVFPNRPYGQGLQSGPTGQPFPNSPNGQLFPSDQNGQVNPGGSAGQEISVGPRNQGQPFNNPSGQSVNSGGSDQVFPSGPNGPEILSGPGNKPPQPLTGQPFNNGGAGGQAFPNGPGGQEISIGPGMQGLQQQNTNSGNIVI